MSEAVNKKLLSLVILFLLATTLFNTIRANEYGSKTTTFRKEVRYHMATTKEALAEQKRINADLQRQIDALVAEQTADLLTE
jgi:restriction endonuclease Mrr